MSEDLKRGARLGNLELLLRVGRGGMATVWVAREKGASREQDRLVAVKAMLPEIAEDPEFTKMFVDEGRLVMRIKHPSVVATYNVDHYDGVLCMVMEWIEGDSLHTLIAEAGKRKAIPPEMAVRIVADAAAGLHAAHEVKDDAGTLMGVVHRDISPHNILIGTDGSVKLVDFGVAKATGRISEATSAGQLKGKFGYMSPEQAMAKPIDRRSDVFSLGIVLFELTTGRRLFRGEHDAETLHLVVSGDIPRPTAIEADYPPRLEQIVMRALERDLSKRYQNAEEFQRDLEAYLKEERILVARAGIGNLLKKVLGEKIEQRRKAVRATLKQLDGEDRSSTLPSDPGATTTETSAITSSGLSDSGITGSAPSTTAPQTVPARGGMGGYVVGIGGLVVAVAVVLFLALRGQGGSSTTTVITQAAPAASEAAPRAATAAPTESVNAVDLSALPADQRPAAQARPAGGAPAGAPAAATTTAKPATKPVAPSGPGNLPRRNPYGD